MFASKVSFLAKLSILSGVMLFLFLLYVEIELVHLPNNVTNFQVLDNDSECERPEYFQSVSSFDMTDGDGDSMADYWEQTYQLDFNDPNDSLLDPDGDGFTNSEEYQANTDPFSARYHPDVIVVTELGFGCFYTVEIGYFNDDDLLDILIRDPSMNYVPAIRDFVMIQQVDGSFEIEDAESYELNELSSIQSTLVLAELT